MVAWCFHPNYCYIHFQYVVAWWKIIFQKSKKPKTHLLMSFNSIRIMAGYTFSIPKINMWSDWLGVSTQTIVIYTFNMLLLYGKSFFRSQKDLKLIYLWAWIALELWLVVHFQHQKSIFRVTGDCCLVFPSKLLLYSILICCWLVEMKFYKSKRPQTHLLMSLNSIRIMADCTFSTPKIHI